MAVRKPLYLRFIDPPESKDDGKGGNDGGGGGGGKVHENGYPKDTPVVEMTDKEQAAYWKFHSRQHEGVAKSRADYDQQKADAEKWRQAQKDQMTPDQKAIDAAAEAARADERKKVAPRLVKAEFKALGKEVPKEILEAFLEDADPLKYLDDNGEVNTDKVQKRVEALTPKQEQRDRRQNHQGYRKTDGVTSVSAGRSLFSDRHKK